MKSLSNDKNFQAIQCVYMQKAMKLNDMQSVTKPSYMWLSKPAKRQVSCKKFSQDDKNCQSTVV